MACDCITETVRFYRATDEGDIIAQCPKCGDFQVINISFPPEPVGAIPKADGLAARLWQSLEACPVTDSTALGQKAARRFAQEQRRIERDAMRILGVAVACVGLIWWLV